MRPKFKIPPMDPEEWPHETSCLGIVTINPARDGRKWIHCIVSPSGDPKEDTYFLILSSDYFYISNGEDIWECSENSYSEKHKCKLLAEYWEADISEIPCIEVNPYQYCYSRAFKDDMLEVIKKWCEDHKNA